MKLHVESYVGEERRSSLHGEDVPEIDHPVVLSIVDSAVVRNNERVLRSGSRTTESSSDGTVAKS